MSNEYPGIYEALIHDLDDPTGQGRARLLVPAILGQAASVWARPVLGKTAHTMAKVGDRAWALFEHGNLNRPTWVTDVTSADASNVSSDSHPHQNSNFDSVAISTAGPGGPTVAGRLLPVDWGVFWNSGDLPYANIISDDNVTLFGRGWSTKVTLNSENHEQNLDSSPFAVTPGSRITFSFWTRSNGPAVWSSILTNSAGNPNWFVPGTTNVDSTLSFPGSVWQKHTMSSVVPVGHVWCMFKIRAFSQSSGPNAATANSGDIWVDNSASSIDSSATATGVYALCPALTANIYSPNIAHNLNAAVVDVAFLTVGSNEPIDIDWKWVDANNIQIRADVAFAAGALKILMTGRS